MIDKLKKLNSKNNCVFLIGYEEDPPFSFSREWEIVDLNENKIGVVLHKGNDSIVETILKRKPIKVIFLDCSTFFINHLSFKAKGFLLDNKKKIEELKRKYENFSSYIFIKIVEEL